MRKYTKLLLIFLLFNLFTFVKAEDYVDVEPTPGDPAGVQAAAIEKYCNKDDKEIEGCLYDSTSSLFTKSTDYRFADGLPDYHTEVHYFNFPKDIPLTTGYQAFDGKGNAIFAGCYKYVKTDDKTGDADTYFLFQIIAKKGKKCKIIQRELVPASDVDGYSGKSAFNAGVYEVAQYSDWVAKPNGDCPGAFGYTANSPKWYQSDSKRYAFSINKEDFTIKTFTLGKETKEEARPGCQVENVDGKKEAQKILDEELKNIKNKACPSKIEDMNSYQNDFEIMYKNILDNRFNVLWSKGLIDQVIYDDARLKIRNEINNKITQCQYSICKIAYGSQDLIKSYLGDKCKNGCRLTVIMPQSNSPSSKCYSCPFNGENVLQWTDINTNGCRPIEDLSKDQCVGTESDLLCRNCLVEAYKHGRLTDEQMSCLVGNEIAKEITSQNLENSNNNAAREATDDQIEINRQQREEVFNRLTQGSQISYDFNIPIGELTGCSQILGKNLTALVKASITILQIIAAIIAILKGMMTLIPPIIAHDADALKKASKTLITMAIILVIIFLFKPLLRFIGSIVDFDTSCII